MLSEYNIEKLNMKAIYKRKPDVKFRGKLFENSLYHCCNWTFQVLKNRKDEYFMRDTYWDSSDSVHIRITDDNINEFELIFDQNEVKRINEDEIHQYDKHYRVAIDSGGHSYPKYFVDIDSSKSKKLIIKEIDKKLESLEREIRGLRMKKESIENGTYKLEWC